MTKRKVPPKKQQWLLVFPANSDLAKAAQSVASEQFEIPVTTCHSVDCARYPRFLSWLSRQEYVCQSCRRATGPSSQLSGIDCKCCVQGAWQSGATPQNTFITQVVTIAYNANCGHIVVLHDSHGNYIGDGHLHHPYANQL